MSPAWEYWTESVQLRERVIVLAGMITDDIANVVIAKLLFLESEAAELPITLALRTPGGHVSSAFAILDTMDYVACEVHTHAVGTTSGVAAMLLAAGARGHRTIARHVQIQLVATPQSHEDDLRRVEQQIVRRMAADTGQFEKPVRDALTANRTFDAEAAIAFGLADRVE